MEKYMVNGQEVEYDTFDLDNMETYDEAVKRVAEVAQAEDATDENYLVRMRETCNAILDAFDAFLGDGMAVKIFGNRVNVKTIMNGYHEFTGAVIAARKSLAETAPQGNREQRRAALHKRA